MFIITFLSILFFNNVDNYPIAKERDVYKSYTIVCSKHDLFETRFLDKIESSEDIIGYVKSSQFKYDCKKLEFTIDVTTQDKIYSYVYNKNWDPVVGAFPDKETCKDATTKTTFSDMIKTTFLPIHMCYKEKMNVLQFNFGKILFRNSKTVKQWNI